MAAKLLWDVGFCLLKIEKSWSNCIEFYYDNLMIVEQVLRLSSSKVSQCIDKNKMFNLTSLGYRDKKI